MESSKRKIAIITGTRAEYGLMYWIMKEVHNDPELELQVLVTGMHLSPEFGLTYKIILQDGFNIDAKVEMLLSSDTPVGIAKSVGLGVIGFADAFDRLKPDIVLLLGDRFEILAAAQAAMIARIPIAHLHGGEATEGVIDEAIRHAVTKMAHFHFVAAEPYRCRIIQMGESPERVMNFGAPGLDNLNRLELVRDPAAFERAIDFELVKPTFLVTYHPVTLMQESPARSMNELLKALDRFPEARIIFTKANADTNGRIINKMIDDYIAENPVRAKAFTSLGQVLYLSALLHIDAVIGNSSSGILEAPAVKKATINVGDRQRGRLRAESVVDCPENEPAIVKSIQKVLSLEFQEKLQCVSSLYGAGDASIRIKEYLKRVELQGILMKRFYEIGM